MPEQVNQLFSYIDTNIIYFLMKICIGLFIFSLLKEFVKSVVFFVLFKSNKYVCIGRRVIVNDFRGFITNIGVNFIVIKNHERVYLIQTSRWQFASWQFEEVVD